MSSATALHEATHAVAALDLGLSVRKVQVRGWIRIPRYCAQLYPGVVRGVPVRSPICLLEEDCLDTHPFEVLVAMAAPAYLHTDDRQVNLYAGLEARLATRHGEKLGISGKQIQSRALQAAAEAEPRACDLAARLEQEGVIHGSDL